MLDLYLHLVIIIPERPVFVDDREVLVHVQPAWRINEDWTADLVDAKVVSRKKLDCLAVERLLLKVLADVVNIVLPAIRHVVGPHFLDLREVKLPRATEPQQEDIVKPGVAMPHLPTFGFDPFFELLQHTVLELVQIA